MILLAVCILVYNIMDAERDKLRFRAGKSMIKQHTVVLGWHIGAWYHRKWWKLGWWQKNVFVMFNDGEHFLKFFSYHILLLPINYELVSRYAPDGVILWMFILFLSEAITTGVLFNGFYYGSWRWDKYE